MKVFKGISFFVYILFTACVVTASTVLFQLSAQLDNAPYATFLDTRYLVQQEENIEPLIPKDSVLLFKASDTPYAVGEYVVYADEYDNTYLGEVKKYTDYDGLKTYEIEAGTEVKTVASLRVLGKADSYSVFLGVLAGATDTLIGRILVCVLPSTLLVLLLIVLICMMIFRHSANKEEVRTEKDEDLFVNLSRDRFLNKDADTQRKPKKTYYNPDVHHELLKYDWLKEAVEATKNEAETEENTELASETPSAPVTESEPDSAPVVTTEPEADAIESETEQENAAEEQPAVTTEKPAETEHKLEPENVVSFSELDAEHQKKTAKSKNESLIQDMRKMLNMDD